MVPSEAMLFFMSQTHESFGSEAPSDTHKHKWTFIITRELTGVSEIGSLVVSQEPSPGDTAIGDEDYRHEFPCRGESSIDSITNPSNERRTVCRAIIKQDVVIAAASFKPE